MFSVYMIKASVVCTGLNFFSILLDIISKQKKQEKNQPVAVCCYLVVSFGEEIFYFENSSS